MKISCVIKHTKELLDTASAVLRFYTINGTAKWIVFSNRLSIETCYRVFSSSFGIGIYKFNIINNFIFDFHPLWHWSK